MEWNEKLQLIIDYVEDHLQRSEEDIDLTYIAQIAQCSFAFFQKTFSYMNGIGFAEYIRNRKMTLAGYDLKSTHKKVVEISYAYGYDSPTSFTKAFQQFHGVSPTTARKDHVELKVFPKMQIFTKQQYYKWRLETKRAFRLIGKSIMISDDDEKMCQAIPKFWSDCQRNGIFHQLVTLDEGNPQGMFGLFTGFDKLHHDLKYSIMVISSKELPNDFEEIYVPEETWAVFDCIGRVPDAIQAGWRYLHEEWLLQYPFHHAAFSDIEWYSNGNSYDENYVSQIWIPVFERDGDG